MISVILMVLLAVMLAFAVSLWAGELNLDQPKQSSKKSRKKKGKLTHMSEIKTPDKLVEWLEQRFIKKSEEFKIRYANEEPERLKRGYNFERDLPEQKLDAWTQEPIQTEPKDELIIMVNQSLAEKV